MASALDPRSFLKTMAPWEGWDRDPLLGKALDALAPRCEVWSFREGDLVRFPDEASPGPTWVAEGCLVVLEDDRPRYVGIREKLEASPGVWVRGQSAGRLVVVPEASWFAWLRMFPEAAVGLGEEVPPPLPRGLVRSPLALEPGETPVHTFRKAPLFLVLRASVPSGFFLLFLCFGLILQFGVDPNVPAAALWFLPGLGMTITAFLIGLVTWEWSVSMLVITNRSVLIRQIDVWTHRSDFEKLALERIREAVFQRRGWTDAVFGLVSLELEGDSPKGRLVFRGLAQNSRFLGAMEALKLRRTATTPGRRLIRQALADRSGGARAPTLEQPAQIVETQGPRVHRLSWRIERNGSLWFRRHPWFAIQRSLPWVGWLTLVVFLGLVAGWMVPSPWTVAGITALASLVPLARIGWVFWDWADDRLSIQGEKIILVHRRPLWLGETRQEGALDQVQQVGVRKDNLAALVFDFGMVTINLGTGTPLEFRDAAHPEWVQNEIFHRRTLLAQDRERQASQDRLDEVSEILDTWAEAQKVGYFTGDPHKNQPTNRAQSQPEPPKETP